MSKSKDPYSNTDDVILPAVASDVAKPLSEQPRDTRNEEGKFPEPPEPEDPGSGPGGDSTDFGADSIMLVVDSLFALMCSALSRDWTPENWKATESNRREMAKQLNMVLEKYSARFEPEYAFLGLVLVSYGPMVFVAIQQGRKTKKKKEKAEEVEILPNDQNNG